MKYFIIASVLFFISISCNETPEQIKERTTPQIIEIDGCQYLKYVTDGFGHFTYTHKGNCNNPIHKYSDGKTNLIAPVSRLDTLTFDTIYLGDQPLFRDTSGTQLDSVWVPLGTEIDVSTAIYPIAYHQYIDSTKYYWKKQIYWEGRMNRELGRLNKNGHANDISKALVRYQDSAIKYSILLKRLQK